MIRQLTRVFQGLAACVLSGCAVLTVDVDVYKGPLANHRHVLTEQTAALAMGAKPLLVQLRDILEIRPGFTLLNCKPGEDQIEILLSNFRREDGYLPRYIPTSDCTYPYFKDSRADRVNALLSLYEDRPGDYLLKLSQDLNEAIDGYLQQLDVLDSRPDEHLAFWRRSCIPQIREPAASALGPLELGESFTKLMKAYEAYFSKEPYSISNQSRVLEWRDAYEDLREKLAGKGDKGKEIAETYGFTLAMPDRNKDPFNAAYAALASESMVRKQSLLLFKQDATETIRVEFIARVTRIASSFIQARTLLAVALKIALTLIEEVSLPSYEKRIRTRDRDQILDLLVKSAVHLIGPNRFCAALQEDGKPSSELRDMMTTALERESTEAKVKDAMDPSKWSYTDQSELGVSVRKQRDAQIRTALTPIFKAAPDTVAHLLLTLHASESAKGASPLRYGLSRGPSAPAAELEELKRDLMEVRQVGMIAARGLLDRGRIAKGLETLIEEYVTSKLNGDGKFADEKLNRLMDALVHFSEKVLVIANNDSLLNRPVGSRGPLISLLGIVKYALVGDMLLPSFASNDVQKSYTRTLQAVGNTILVQVDEMRHWDDFEKNQDKAHQREVFAAGATLGPWRARLDGDLRVAENALAESEAAIKALSAAQGALLNGKDGSPPASADDFVTALGTLQKPDPSLIRIAKEVAPGIKEKFLWKTLFEEFKVGLQSRKGRQEELIRGLKAGIDLTETLAKAPVEGKQGKAKETLDLFIATLNYLRIEASGTHGPDSVEVKRLEASLKAAYQRRAELVYIRPPAAYLRTSFPATSLQQDAKLEWRNMLSDQGLRSLPLVGGAFANAGMEVGTVQEIDKQFWQNINRVRVSGVGNTNYVVAKDDVGNWYVKNYSADPEPIINSAKNLAKFGLGAATKTNLLTKAADAAKTGTDAKTDDKAKENSPALEKVFTQQVEDYAARAKKDLESLEKHLETLSNDVKNAVQSDTGKDLESFKSAVDKAAEELSKEVSTAKAKTPAVASDQVLDILWAVRRFHGRVVRGIGEAKTGLIEEEPVKKKAVQAATRAVRSLLERFLDRRKLAVEGFEGALNAIRKSAE